MIGSVFRAGFQRSPAEFSPPFRQVITDRLDNAEIQPRLFKAERTIEPTFDFKMQQSLDFLFASFVIFFILVSFFHAAYLSHATVGYRGQGDKWN